jgi:hypothetical protein
MLVELEIGVEMLNVCAVCPNCEQHATNCGVARSEQCDLERLDDGREKHRRLFEQQPLRFTARPSVAKSG